MSTKQATLRGLGALLIVVLIVAVAVLLVPSFATILARLVADLWITVMSAVAGLLGWIMGV